ncbi:transposase (plasmid) [Rippkaea orientalis PCC 8801]|uniref:Transposase n=1 Tax=Rippkaea orientalis (strain PCC 8801 / RF-1) TaxID=41431 RepID=B7JXH3_RIPO1|nr:IS630 family transposase [Rippkaea orientalis]ACK64730.1 transposase [Rippkaea orientalis PCC 8801]ACK66035.1 transposase [Rippkaea orientalis PCC 8801]ACK68378.1 transposase [Rippkaea orientalis PCC 8801]
MILLRELSTETKKLLITISRLSKSPQVRNRSQCIILSYERVSIPQLRKLFRVSEKTIYNWLNRWEAQGLLGLYNEKGRGRKAKLSQEQQEHIKQWVKEEPKNLKKVALKIYQQWKIDVSKETIKRIIKKLNMLWKRMKRGLAKSPEEWELEVKMPKLLELKEQDKKGEIDLRYLDESGFSLMPYIPYAWQEKGSTITLKSSQSKRINVLGLMNRHHELYYEIYSSNINSQVVINFLDKFSQNLSKQTVIIMDQASIHTSDNLLKKLEEWEQRNLKIFWLPTYSPQQNLIEILWKFVKYEWVEVDAYENWTSLLNYLKKVLDNFGQEYVINFV